VPLGQESKQNGTPDEQEDVDNELHPQNTLNHWPPQPSSGYPGTVRGNNAQPPVRAPADVETGTRSRNLEDAGPPARAFPPETAPPGPFDGFRYPQADTRHSACEWWNSPRRANQRPARRAGGPNPG